MENIEQRKEESIKTEDLNGWQKKIALFLTSQAVSLFGSAIVQYAIIWYITIKTGSGMMMTMASICGFLPQIFISIFAGVWADKHDKKSLIVIADSCIALSTLIIAICFLMEANSIWLLILALGIRSLGAGVQTPTVNSFIPVIVPEDKLMRVNGINTTIQSIMLIISPAVAGGVLGLMDIGKILFIDVITAVIGVVILVLAKLPYTKVIEEGEKLEYYKTIKEGLKYVTEHKFIRRFFGYYIILAMLLTPVAILTPLMVTRSFGEEVWRLTWNEIVFFVGSIIRRRNYLYMEWI